MLKTTNVYLPLIFLSNSRIIDLAVAHKSAIKKITCPWCGRGETLGTAEAQGIVSLVCPKCGRYYIADFSECKSQLKILMVLSRLYRVIRCGNNRSAFVSDERGVLIL